MLKKLLLSVGLFLLVGGALGCATEWPEESNVVPAGNPRRGAELLETHGCVSCHAVPEISATVSYVGPPLEKWPQRNYIAGEFVNTPANLIRWIQDPQEMRPGSAMPDMGIDRRDARDIAAFLYQLEGEPVHWLVRDGETAQK